VFNLVCGRGAVVGKLRAASGCRHGSFTGSTRAGKRVSELAAATVKRVALELAENRRRSCSTMPILKKQCELPSLRVI
jgi:acyl-CoA reductase-like NAD-dependent aldehyde dehydrogenase